MNYSYSSHKTAYKHNHQYYLNPKKKKTEFQWLIKIVTEK